MEQTDKMDVLKKKIKT